MYIEELLIILVIALGVLAYRNYQGQNIGKFITVQVQQMYDRFAPYSFKVVREKTKDGTTESRAFYNTKKHSTHK